MYQIWVYTKESMRKGKSVETIEEVEREFEKLATKGKEGMVENDNQKIVGRVQWSETQNKVVWFIYE